MTTSLHFSSWKPQKQSSCVSQILLDKPNIIKKMRSLMLEVKPLQTKMFISKVISYMSNDMIEIKQQQTQQQQQVCCLFLKQNKSAVSTVLQTKDLIDQNKQTADSNYFSEAKNRQDADLDTVSETQTISCSCGLFDMVLKFVQSLIDANLIQNKTDQFQINQQFFQQLSKQIYKKVQDQISQKVQQHQVQTLKTTQNILQLKNQLQKQISEKLTWKQQLKQFRQLKYVNLQEELTRCVKKNQSLEKQVQELKAALNQFLEEKDGKRRKRSLIRNSQIDGLKLQIQLKDHEILNLRTIVQTLQKNVKSANELKQQLEQKQHKLQLKHQSQINLQISKIQEQVQQKDEQITMIREQLNSISTELQNMYEINSIKEENILQLQQQVKYNKLKNSFDKSQNTNSDNECQQCKTKSEQIDKVTKIQISLLQEHQLLKRQFIGYQTEQIRRVKLLEGLLSKTKSEKMHNDYKKCQSFDQNENEQIRITFGSQM